MRHTTKKIKQNKSHSMHICMYKKPDLVIEEVYILSARPKRLARDTKFSRFNFETRIERARDRNICREQRTHWNWDDSPWLGSFTLMQVNKDWKNIIKKKLYRNETRLRVLICFFSYIYNITLKSFFFLNADTFDWKNNSGPVKHIYMRMCTYINLKYKRWSRRIHKDTRIDKSDAASQPPPLPS